MRKESSDRVKIGMPKRFLGRESLVEVRVEKAVREVEHLLHFLSRSTALIGRHSSETHQFLHLCSQTHSLHDGQLGQHLVEHHGVCQTPLLEDVDVWGAHPLDDESHLVALIFGTEERLQAVEFVQHASYCPYVDFGALVAHACQELWWTLPQRDAVRGLEGVHLRQHGVLLFGLIPHLCGLYPGGCSGVPGNSHTEVAPATGRGAHVGEGRIHVVL